MSKRNLLGALAVICMHLMVFTPFVYAGAEPAILTMIADEPDPGQAHYGYVVSFDLEAQKDIKFPPEMTGTITASDGQAECTATLPELNCVLIPSAPGTLTINASYSGDGNYTADNADSISHEVFSFQLPEVVSRGEGLGPGLFPNQARDIAISANAQHVAVGVSTPSIYTESGKTPSHGVFVYDIPDRSWELVSVNSDGSPGGGDLSYPGAAYAPSISANGRWVAFETFHSDLGGADPADVYNVYLFDRDSGNLYWVSEDMNGGHGRGRAPSVSDDGQFVAFESNSTTMIPGDTNVRTDVFVWDRTDGSLKRISVDNDGNQGTGNSEAPSISANGRFVAFQSDAPNLVTGDTNNKTDIFVFDRQDEVIERVSIDSVGVQGAHDSEAASISGDGRYVVFESHRMTSHPNGFWQIYRRDRTLNSTILASLSDSDDDVFADHHRGEISVDGNFVTFDTNGNAHVTGDTNGEVDVFLRDIQLQTTKRISVNADGSEADGPSWKSDVSANGQRTVFLSSAPNIVEIPVGASRYFPIVHDPDSGTRSDIRISGSPAGSIGNGDSEYIRLSQDGRFATFSSQADNLVPDDTNGVADIFVRDRENQTVERVSISTGGDEGNRDSLNPAISSDGRFVVFDSKSSSFSGTSTSQVHLFDRIDQTLILVSEDTEGGTGNGDSIRPVISGDGHYVAFYSKATDLIPFDTNGNTPDLYIFDVQGGTTVRVLSPGDAGVDLASNAHAPSNSDDGRYTAFVTGNFEVWVWDRMVGSLIPSQNSVGQPLRSQAGRLDISADGKLLALNTYFPVLEIGGMFLYDFSTHEAELIADNVIRAHMSADGRFMVAARQRSGGFDIHLFDTTGGATRMISQDAMGNRGNGSSRLATISADGKFIGFESDTSNLVPNDSNGRKDVFVFENPLYGLPPGVLFSSGFEAGE